MNIPKVSIQIPCYNQEHCIKRAVESALAQTYEHIEVVVCDDQSQDDTFAILSAMNHPKLKVFQNEKNLNRVNNYHRLLYELVNGDWIVNLDGDDWFTDPDYIKRAVHLVTAYPSVVWYHANQRNLSLISKLISTERIDEATLKMNGLDYIQIHSKVKYFYHISSMFKRTLAMEAGFYTQYSLNSDYVSLLKLCKYGDIIQSSHRVATWDLNVNSASMGITSGQSNEMNKLAINHLVDSFKDVLSKEEINSLSSDLQQLNDFYYRMSEVLFYKHSIAIKKLVKYASMNKDYFIILAMYLAKRILKIRKI